MFTDNDIKKIQELLPTSAVQEIQRKTRISKPTIYRFLRGEKIRSEFQVRIYLAALKIIEQGQKMTKRILQERSRILDSVEKSENNTL